MVANLQVLNKFSPDPYKTAEIHNSTIIKSTYIMILQL